MNNNYEKAKEEGIEELAKLHILEQGEELVEEVNYGTLESFLSSFAEKIKDGVEKDCNIFNRVEQILESPPISIEDAKKIYQEALDRIKSDS